MFVFDSYPDYIKDISDKYPNATLIDKNTLDKQRNYCYIIMTVLHFFISFNLGVNLYYYHNSYRKAFIMYIVYFILALFYIIPLHYFIMLLFFPVKLNSSNWFMGINLKLFMPFCYCKKEISKFRIILAIVVMFLLLTGIPYFLMSFYKSNMLLYAIGSCNALLTSFEFYDLYILITKTKKNNMVLKSNNLYYAIGSDKTNNTDSTDIN